MERYALLAILKAKAGKENEVSKFLSDAVELAKKEEKTISWYSFQIDNNTFGIFDTFEGEDGRDAHLNGEIAEKLMASAEALLSEQPDIKKIDILAAK